jgi:hypothetical protein
LADRGWVADYLPLFDGSPYPVRQIVVAGNDGGQQSHLSLSNLDG